jgi:hypothetical protein
MPTVSELENSGKPPLGAALAAGVKVLSADQQIAFSLYRRYVFPLDGMNYWIKVPSSTGSVQTAGTELTPGLASQTMVSGEAIQVAPGGLGALDTIGGVITNPIKAVDQGLLQPEVLFVDFTGPAYLHETGTTTVLFPGDSIDIPPGSMAWVNAATGGHQFTIVIQTSVSSVTMPTDVVVQGSFHYDSTVHQEEDATFDSNTIIFTAMQEVQPFNMIGPDYLYIGRYNNLTFAFSHRGRLYEQADLHHYRGQALRSRHLNMIIDDYTQFNPTLTVSNSLPIWLNMPNYVPPYPGFTCNIPLYPSYLVTDNLPPPYGAIHIEKTKTIEMGTAFGPRLQQSQLVEEDVKVHLYGCDNLMASDFVAFVEQYSVDWMKLGLSDSPAIQDLKLPSPEFEILAQRKLVEFHINYRQWAIRDEFRQFIEHCKVQYFPQWLLDDHVTVAYYNIASGTGVASAAAFPKGTITGVGAAYGLSDARGRY